MVRTAAWTLYKTWVLRGCAVLMLLLPQAPAAAAQTIVDEGSTLHVYSTLLQIPVLILSNKHQPLPTLPAAEFQVRLGTDVPFRPSVVRLEGDDPITLAVLLDGSSGSSLLPEAADGLAAMVRDHLRPHDRVAVYTMDGCKLLRLSTLGAMHPNAMRLHVQQAAAHVPYDAYTRNAQPCPAAIGLWEAVDYLTRTLADEPGRRVVLAVTNGTNHVNHLSADIARRNANHDGVTVFAVAERYKVPLLGPVYPQTTAGWRVSSLLAELTEGSGGMIVESTRNDVTHAFALFIALLRGRYIVEFPRPAHTVAGVSTLDIRCGLPKAFIRPAGTSMPIADPVPRDPNVQHGTVASSIGEALPAGTSSPAETSVPVADSVLPATSVPVADSVLPATGTRDSATPVTTSTTPHLAVPHATVIDITEDAVPMGAALPVGTAVK